MGGGGGGSKPCNQIVISCSYTVKNMQSLWPYAFCQSSFNILCRSNYNIAAIMAQCMHHGFNLEPLLKLYLTGN